jgi:hypothetical protein
LRPLHLCAFALKNRLVHLIYLSILTYSKESGAYHFG